MPPATFILHNPTRPFAADPNASEKIFQAKVSLENVIQITKRFASESNRRDDAETKLVEFRKTPGYVEEAKKLAGYKNTLQQLTQTTPDVAAARKYLGPAYFFSDDAYDEYIENTQMTAFRTKVKLFAGLTVAALEALGSQIGIGVLAFTCVDKATTDANYRWAVATGASICVLVSYALPATRAKYRLGTWQEVSYKRVGVTELAHRASIETATSAMFESYMDPILAVGMNVIGAMLLPKDRWMIGVALASSLVIEAGTYLAVREDGDHKKAFGYAVYVGAAAAAAGLTALAFTRPKEKYVSASDDEFSTGVFQASVAFPALVAFWSAATYFRKFLDDRDKVQTALGAAASNIYDAEVSVVKVNVEDLERKEVFQNEKKLVSELESATNACVEEGKSLIRNQGHLREALEVLERLKPQAAGSGSGQ